MTLIRALGLTIARVTIDTDPVALIVLTDPVVRQPKGPIPGPLSVIFTRALGLIGDFFDTYTQYPATRLWPLYFVPLRQAKQRTAYRRKNGNLVAGSIQILGIYQRQAELLA